MNGSPLRILTLCGSLRAQSSNRAILRAYEHLALPSANIEHYERLGALPHFNPDLDTETASIPAEVRTFREAVQRADAIVISTPEYAHGLPGAFKNALDWLVSDPSFAGKPVAIVFVERGSTWALDSLREILRTISARIVDDAVVGLPLSTNQVDEAALLARDDVTAPLRRSIAAIERAVRAS